MLSQWQLFKVAELTFSQLADIIIFIIMGRARQFYLDSLKKRACLHSDEFAGRYLS